MSARFGVVVLLIATAAWLVAESQSFGGHRHRRGRCGGHSSCGSYSGCNTGCNTGGCGSYSGCGTSGGCNTGCDPCGATVVTEGEAAPAAPSPSGEAAPPPPPAPDKGAAAPAPAKSTPVVQSTSGGTRYYYTNARRARWSRR